MAPCTGSPPNPMGHRLVSSLVETQVQLGENYLTSSVFAQTTPYQRSFPSNLYKVTLLSFYHFFSIAILLKLL